MMMASVSDLKEEEGWTVIAFLLFSISRQKHQQLFKNQVTNFIEIARTLKQAAVIEFVGQEKNCKLHLNPVCHDIQA
jgi:hypothetical protein